MVCLQVKLCDPHLSALEVRFSRRGAIQIYVCLPLPLPLVLVSVDEKVQILLIVLVSVLPRLVLVLTDTPKGQKRFNTVLNV